uniref:MADF domain-containing protein n=1 Tax=Caenorhabditis tropicalis TaxID=1561998 RepID=A0A1I7U209_9PELO
MDPTRPKPLYQLNPLTHPLPPILFETSLDEYRKVDHDGHKNKWIREVILRLIYNRPELWLAKNVKVKAIQWEEVGLELFRRTEQALSISKIREFWRASKTSLRQRLQKLVEIEGKNPSETEIGLLKWPLYPHIKFYRTVLRDLEDEWRKKALGLSYNEEIIRDEAAYDDEIECIGFFEGDGRIKTPMGMVKPEEHMEQEN